MKAKSYLFTAASATLLLASCSQSEVVEMPASRAIGFGTYVSNTARAAAQDTDLEFLKGDGNGFYVFGKYLDGSEERTVFDGTSTGSHVTWSASSWGYSPINYWLDGKTYKFAAYGPAKVNGNGTAKFDYTTNTLSIANFSADGSTDLVVAEGNNAGYTPSETTTTETPVSFKFFHALSKVKFTFVNGWRNTVTLKLSDVKIEKVANTGTLTTTGTLNTATTPMPSSVWAVETGTTEYNANDNFISPTYQEKYEVEHFLIPQELPTGDKAIILSFTAQVNNASGSGPDLGDGAGRPVTKTVTIPADQIAAWEPGKAYNYTLIVDGSTFDLKPIQFDNITVETWADGADDNLDREDIND